MQDQELAAVDLADVDALKFEVRESRGELARWQRGEKKRLQLGLAVPVSHFFKCATRLKKLCNGFGNSKCLVLALMS